MSRASAQTVTSGDIEDIYPLSPIQQGMLYQTLRAPQSGAYIEQLTVTFRGRLHVPVFEQAWRRIVERHGVLRSSYMWQGLEEPLQVVHRDVPLPFMCDNWSELSDEEARRRFDERLRADGRAGFDLERAPLMRLWLVDLGSDRWRFTFTHHHLLLDGWSLGTLLGELFEVYVAETQGRPARLPSVRPYRDYIAWLRAQDIERARAFWSDRLHGFAGPTPLGIERRVTPLAPDEDRYHRRRLTFTGEQTATLRAWARRHRVTLNTMTQGCWALLLGRYSGHTEVTFGVTSAGRPPELAGAERMVGPFINTLPARIALPRDAGITDWLIALQRRQAEQRSYEFAPLAEIRRWLALDARRPLFESLLVFESYPVASALRLEEAGLTIEDTDFREWTGEPLTVVVEPAERLSIALEYDVARIGDEAAARVLGHVEVLLSGLVASGDTDRVRDLTPIAASEEHRLLDDWSGRAIASGTEPAAASVSGADVIDRIWARLDATNATPALVASIVSATDEHDRNGAVVEEVGYDRLGRMARGLAARLVDRGVGPDVPVAVLADRSAASVAAILAILGAGGAYVPLDAAQPDDRLRELVEDSGATLLVVPAPLRDRASRLPMPCLSVDDRRDATDAIHAVEMSLPRPAPADALAYVLHTSGSTGRPKGVMVSRRNLAWSTLAREMAYGERIAAFLLLSPLSFDSSVAGLFWTLRDGGTLVVPPEGLHYDPAALATLIRDHRVSHLLALPSLYELLLERHADVLATLRTVIVAGETCPPRLVHRHVARLPGVRLFNEYGPTEGTVWATVAAIDTTPRAGEPVSIGRPAPGAQVFVLNVGAEAGTEPVPTGVPGEAYVGGFGVTRGYVRDPERTADRFRPNPWPRTPGERLYRTGDRARYRADGTLEFLGRFDHQVKIRGVRVEPAEIESVLRTHPAVRDAVVIANESRHADDRRLVAYWIASEDAVRDEACPAADDLDRWLRQKLPGAMVPSAFMRVAAFPTTATGKIDRGALVPPVDEPAPAGAVEAPADELEARLLSLWRAELKDDSVGVLDDFFARGGHSLRAVALLGRIRDVLGDDVPLAWLFACPSVRAFANIVRGGRDRMGTTIVDLRASGIRPPLILVHGAGGGAYVYRDLVAHLPADQPVWAIDAAPHSVVEHIEEIASAYAALVRHRRPAEPYVLAGWSMGGAIAFEMARLLHHEGAAIDRVLLLDASVPHLRGLSGPPPGDAAILQRATDLGLDPSDTDPTLAAHVRALWRYRPGDCDVPLTLFRAAERRGGGQTHAGADDFGWSRVAHGRHVDVHIVPGDHDSMLREPNVIALAAAIERARLGRSATTV